MTTTVNTNPSSRPPDQGASLIEILVAVVLLGSAGVGVLASLAAAATGASVQRSMSSAQVWLATTGDAISDARGVYLDCAGNSTSEIIDAYQDVVDAVSVVDAPHVVVADVKFWDGSGFGTDCHYDAGNRLQQVELSTTVHERASSLTVVKRPDTQPIVDLGPIPPGDAGGVDGAAAVEPTPGLGES